MPVQGEFFQNPGSGASAFYDYQINQSARFDQGSSSYLSRTPSGAGSSQTTLTISFWFKRAGTSASNMYLITAYTSSSSRAAIFFYPDDGSTGGEMQSFGFGNSYTVKTDARFRDFSGWGHLVLRIDTTQSTADDRVRMYLNGNQLTLATNTQPSQNNTLVWNTAIAHYIGAYYSGQVLPYDGYLAEFIMADGQSYAPTQFGESKNGVWIPKDPSGTTFGNNGFHLKFADSGATITPTGASSSGASAISSAESTIIALFTAGTSPSGSPTGYNQSGQGALTISIDLGSAKNVGRWYGKGAESSGYATRTATGTVYYSDNNSDFTSVGSSTFTFGNGVAANGHSWTASSHRYWKIEFPSASGGDGSSGYQIASFQLYSSNNPVGLGADSSGNGNNFTATNMGADHQVLDSPTFGSD